MIPTANGGPFTPLTEGLHQRCNDSYFVVYFNSVEPGVVEGYYWCNADVDGEWDGDWISGPYSTVTDAAEAGWAGTTLVDNPNQ